MDVVGTLLSSCVIAFIWGLTNVAIKQSSTSLARESSDTWIGNFILDVKFFICNFRVFLPFLINQCGSVLFYFVLLHSELSLIVPVTNTLTFLFTALVSVCTGESLPSKRTVIGSAFVVLGITLCVTDKLTVKY